MRALIAAKADLEAVDIRQRRDHAYRSGPGEGHSDGWTPLITAASNGHREAVKLLLKAGANASAADRDGETPLIRARASRHPDCVALIEKHLKDHK